MSQFSLLTTRRFMPMFCTQFLGAFNDNIYKNSLVIFIAFTLADQATINSSILVIMAGGLFILPYFLFSALAGQLADKYEKSMIVRYVKLAEIIIMGLAIPGFATGNVTILMTVLFLMGTHSTFFGPLKYGILPQHLQLPELTGANGLVQMATYLAILGGTIIGGILVAIEGYGIYLVSALLIIVALAGWYASRFIPEAEPADSTIQIDWNLFRQTWRILRQSIVEKDTFIAMIAISWFWFLGASYLSLVPTYTRDVLGGDELVATLLLTAFSLGIGSGSLLCERLSRGHIEPGLVPVGALGLTLFAIDLFLIGDPVTVSPGVVGPMQFLSVMTNWRIISDLVCIGFFGGIYIVPLYAMIQNRSIPAFRSRTIAANNILNALFMVASALLVIGFIKLAMTIPQIYLLIGIMNLLVTGLIFFIFPEYLQRFSIIIRRPR
jgi:MFS family permease